MELDRIVERVQSLSDLELAALLCLIAKQHCIIETEDDFVDDLAQELALIVSELFRLSYAVVSDDEQQTIDEFGIAILEREHGSIDAGSSGHRQSADGAYHHDHESCLSSVNFRGVGYHADNAKLDTRKVVNVVIAKNFNSAPHEVQIQAMELIQRRRIFSRTTRHVVPEQFMFITVVPNSMRHKRFNKHLLDRVFISHYHDPADGFPTLESMEMSYGSDEGRSGTPLGCITTRDTGSGVKQGQPITVEMIDRLRALGQAATMSAEVRAYLQNIVVFMKLERGVAGGVSPYATVLFEALSKYLAPLHGLDYVTPSLVALAARKIYPHRIIIAAPEMERSMQWGSELDAVRVLLDEVTPESVIAVVLNTVETPL
jgi:MoxR-like ATPase